MKSNEAPGETPGATPGKIHPRKGLNKAEIEEGMQASAITDDPVQQNAEDDKPITDDPIQQNDNDEDEKQHEPHQSPSISQMISHLSNSTPNKANTKSQIRKPTQTEVNGEETTIQEKKPFTEPTLPNIPLMFVASILILLMSIFFGINWYDDAQQIVSDNNKLQCPYNSNQLPIYVHLASQIKILSATYDENTTFKWIINHNRTECEFTSDGDDSHKLLLQNFDDCNPFKLDLKLMMNRSKNSKICEVSLSFHEDPVFGIDLGTTYSCISYQKNILNKDDRRDTTIVRLDKKLNRYCIPSIVYFTVDHRGNKQMLFGESAVNKMKDDPQNVISDIKRIVGRSVDDKEIETFKENHLFKIMDDHKNVFIPNWNETVLLEQILSFLLTHLVEIASKEWYYDNIEYNPIQYIGNIVVSVPALFHNGQRKSVRSSCHLAGLHPLKLVIEPSAASLAYSYYNTAISNKLKLFLAFDFGGGTLDCSVMRCSGVECDVLSVHGDSALGGIDFDNVIRDIIITKYEEEYQWEISDKMYSKIHRLSEKVKIHLTFSEQYQLSLKNDDDITKSVMITREEFEKDSRTKQLIESAINVAKKAIQLMNYAVNNIRMILMIGGSSKIPIIQSSLRKEFGDILVLSDDIDAQLMVATGTGIVGGAFAYSRFIDDASDVVLTDLIPMSIGFEICIGDKKKVKQCGIMKEILQKNDPFPTEETIEICQEKPNGNVLKLKLFEGDNKYTQHNYLLGKIQIDDIKPRDPKICDNVLLRFMVDNNGIFTVEATTNKKYGSVQKYNITIASENSKQGTIKPEEIIELTQTTISWYNAKSFPLRRKSYTDDPELTHLFEN